MRLHPHNVRFARRLSTVTALATALCAGMTLLTPAAVAKPAAAESVVCESTSRDTLEAPQPGNPTGTRFTGTGTITCLDAQGQPYLEGTTEFSGTLPSLTTGATPLYSGRVDWSDGTVTTGTLTDFSTQAGEGGILQFTIKGSNDADSTRFGGYSVSITGQSVREIVDPTGEIHSTQKGTVTYTL
ncbi:hypothetical protein ACWGHA_36490 [Streptomyces xanthophaeus]